MKLLRYLMVMTLLWPVMSYAAEKVQFSAEAVMSRGDQQMHRKMYVGQSVVRTEMEMGGRKMIQIMNMGTGTAWTLFPDSKTYYEMKSPPGGGQMNQADTSQNPCAGMKNMTCKNLGVETVNGRQANKWQISGKVSGQEFSSLQWIDKQRNWPIRTFHQDGAVTELMLVGKEVMNGRHTEKWEAVNTSSDGKEQRLTQWYDPEIRSAVREEMPGGLVNELKNIRVGAQSSALFSLPAGYKKVKAPSMGSMGQQQQQRGQGYR
ncbi:MAG: DUF4412 domain-containing protein [Gammaproteobacteria bacterium]|nr:MAG: DUF4412 domain-containing protein [Gammaproteobacteria bacterium]